MNMSTLKDKLLDIVYPSKYAFAHCDIPCGIYDPHTAQLDALTIVRMNQLIADLGDDSESQTKLGRYMSVKETHAESCKNELRIIWADYFKPEHLEKYPNLHDLFWNANKLAGANKQNVSSESAKQLVEAVDEISKIFWESKGVTYSDPNADVRFGA